MAMAATKTVESMAQASIVQMAEGVEDVMSALFSNAIPDAIPQLGEEDSWREIGDMERNTPPAKSGYEQMWIRGWYADDKPDVKNLSRMQRKGWKPRIPDEGCKVGYSVLAYGNQSIISVNRMILMERRTDAGDQYREQNRKRIAIQSAGANLDQNGMFDDRMARMFGSVKTTSKIGRDAADLIDN